MKKKIPVPGATGCILSPSFYRWGTPRDVEPLFPKGEISDRADEYIEKHNL